MNELTVIYISPFDTIKDHTGRHLRIASVRSADGRGVVKPGVDSLELQFLPVMNVARKRERIAKSAQSSHQLRRIGHRVTIGSFAIELNESVIAESHKRGYRAQEGHVTESDNGAPGRHEQQIPIQPLVGKDHPLYGRQMYRQYLGPDYYSFQFGQAPSIGLSSVDYDDLWYYGHLDQAQLEWLDRYLLLVPAGSAVVTFGHCPS